VIVREQLRAEPASFHPDNRIRARIKRSRAPERFHRNHGFFDFSSAACDRGFDDETQKLPRALSICECRTREDSVELRAYVARVHRRSLQLSHCAAVHFQKVTTRSGKTVSADKCREDLDEPSGKAR
jgi:hypothetical protein